MPIRGPAALEIAALRAWYRPDTTREAAAISGLAAARRGISSCEWRVNRPAGRISCSPLLVAVLVALWIPATGHAAERDEARVRRAAWSGAPATQSAGGSDAVRILQRRLRRLGTEPGPIDGLYGPLTQGAVERFQQRHGLAVDGIVGRQTRRSLFSRSSQPTAVARPARARSQARSRASRRPRASGPRAQIEQPHARPVPAADAASRAGPASGTSGVPPEADRGARWPLPDSRSSWPCAEQGEVRLNFGLTCAALLGVFGIGAVAGAIFATRAAPHGTDGATAQPACCSPDSRAATARHVTSPPRAHADRSSARPSSPRRAARPARASTGTASRDRARARAGRLAGRSTRPARAPRSAGVRSRRR